MTRDLALVFAAAVLTYVVHSTLLLSAAWLIDRGRRLPSHALREWLWKTAAVAPIVTTALALTCQWSHPVLQLSLSRIGLSQDVDVRHARDEFAGSSESVGRAAAAPRTTEPGTIESPPTNVATSESRETRSAPQSPRVENDAGAGECSGAVAPSTAPIGAPHPAPHEVASSAAQSSSPPASQSTSLADPSVASLPQGEDRSTTMQFDNVGVRSSDRSADEAGWLGPLVPTTASAAWPAACLLVLGLCVTGGIALCLMRCARLARYFASATVLRAGPARVVLDRLCRRARLWRSVRLMASPRTHEPLACGVLRPTIVLPLHIEQRLSRRQLEALLAHELAHLVRGDAAWLWIGQLLCTCLVFQPLNLLARRRWQAAAEFQCDDWALARGVAPLDLAGCLAEVASWRLEGLPAPAGLTATGKRSDVGQRIRRLAESHPPADRWSSRTRRLTLGAAAVVLTAGFALWAPRAAWTSPQRQAMPRDLHDQPTPTSESRATAEGNFAAEIADKSDDAAQWQQFNIELRELSDSLARLAAALADQPDDPELSSLGQSLRGRAAELESRRIRLITRYGGDIPDFELNAASSAPLSPSSSPGASP